ncbi:MAG: cytochrome c oxidase subunit II [Solirubrobacterales bacterium]
MKDMTRQTFLRLAGLALLLTVVISVIMLIPDWNGLQGSVEAGPIDQLLNVTIVLSSFVFSVVMVMMGYAIRKYRVKPGDEGDGEPIHGNTKLEIVWTLIPTLIVLFLGVYSWVVLDDIEARADGPTMRVDAYTQQFAWRFDYPDAGKSSTELHVPSGTQLELHLTALDVLHSFWVPEWRVKRDMVPGADIDGDPDIDNILRVTPDVEGTYSVICAELCGIGHSIMRAVAKVESQAEFDAWVATQPDTPEGKVSTGVGGGQGAGSLVEGAGSIAEDK